MATSNVIEILLRAKDETASVLSKFKNSLLSVKGLVAGVFAAGIAGQFIKNTEEAEAALAQLRNALQNAGDRAKVTEKQLLEQAAALQKVTRYGDEAVQTTQALLLRYQNISGSTLLNATKATTDLAEALRVDLASAARLVGLALDDPAQGLSLMRRYGIQFSESQKDLLKSLKETGQVAKAQAIVLSELEKRFGGAAEAGGNTLGGALAKLKNAFGDLFEASEKDSGKVVDGLNKITSALQNPETKKAVDILAGAFGSLFATIVEGAAKGVTGIQKLIDGTKEYNKLQGQIAMLRDPVQGQEAWNRLQGFSGPSRRFGRNNSPAAPGASEDNTPAAAVLDEIKLLGAAAKGAMQDNPVQNLFLDMERSTRTSTQEISANIDALRLKLKILQSEVTPANLRIGKDDAAARLKEGLDQLLPEFDIQKIREMKKPVQAELSELSQFSIGVFRRMGESISQAFSDALYEGKTNLQALKDIVRRTLADIGATIISSGLKKLIAETFGGGSTGTGGGGTNWAGAILSGIGSFFGFKAGGGRADGPTVIGNELVVPSDSMQVFNQRQLAFMGAGQKQGVVYAPNYTITIEARDAKDAERRLAEYVETRFAEERAELSRDMQRNGIGVLK